MSGEKAIDQVFDNLINYMTVRNYVEKTPLEELNANLKRFVKAHKEMKESHIPESVLIAYLCYTTKLSKKIILQVIDSQEKFYEEFTTKLAEDEL